MSDESVGVAMEQYLYWKKYLSKRQMVDGVNFCNIYGEPERFDDTGIILWLADIWESKFG